MLDYDKRPDDIYIVTYRKSGTTWMQMIMYQLTSDGDINFNHIDDVSPFLDRNINENKKIRHLASPRIIKTHFTYDKFPKNWPGKYIYVMRHGMDVAVSQYYQFCEFNEEYEGKFDEFFYKVFMKTGGWFKHVADWCSNKSGHKVLYIRYEDLSDDLEGCIRKIINFCEISIEESELPGIMDRCSFNYMKQYKDKFSRIPEKRHGSVIRKGKVMEGEKYLDDSQKRLYEKKFKKYLGKYNLDSYNSRPNVI